MIAKLIPTLICGDVNHRLLIATMTVLGLAVQTIVRGNADVGGNATPLPRSASL